MFIKKELMAFPTTEMPSKKMVPEYNMPESAFVCTAQSIKDGILEVDIWALNVDTPLGLTARVFFNKKDKRHISLVYGSREFNSKDQMYVYKSLKQPKWSEASLEVISGGNPLYTNLNKKLVVTDDSAALIKRYFNSGEKSSVDALGDFQKKIRDTSNKKKNEAKRKAVAQVMSQIKPLPDDWPDFVENNAMLDARYIIYERTKSKKVVGFCTKCGNTVSLPSAKHNTKGTCPSCGSVVWLKASGITHYIHNESRAHYIQPTENGAFIIREFSFYRRFQEGFRTWEQHEWENRRYFVSPDGEIKMFDKYDGRWRSRITLDYMTGYLYPENVRMAISGTVYRYCAAEVLAQNRVFFGLVGWLSQYRALPLIEYFPKMKLFRLSSDFSFNHHRAYSVINQKAKTPADAFPFSREAIKMFCDMDMGAEEISAYADYVKHGYRMTPEHLIECRKERIYPTVLLGLPMCVSPFTALRYFKKQKTSDHSYENLISIWRDYLKMAADVGYDLSEEYYLLPPKLIVLHDELDAITRLKKIKPQYIESFRKLALIYAPFNYTGKNFIIRVPNSMEDLIYNAMKQKICVANPTNGYIQAYCSKKTYLFLLRKKDAPDDPYVTFEMSTDGHVGQISAQNNHYPPADVRQAIESWKKQIALPLLESKKSKARIPVAV